MAKKETSFSKLVNETVEEIKSMNADSLNFYRRLGSRCADLVNAPASYGNKTVDMFCQELNEKAIMKIQPNTVYCAVRVYKSIGDKGYDSAIKASMTWRNLLWLGNKSLTEDGAKEILDDIVSGKLSQLEAKEAVHVALGSGEGGGNDGTTGSTGTSDVDDADVAQALRMVKNIYKLFNTVQQKVDGYSDAVQSIIDANNVDTISDTKRQLDEFHDAYESMKSIIDKEFVAAEKKMSKFA